MIATVIKANGKAEFEDGLRTGALPETLGVIVRTALNSGSIPIPSFLTKNALQCVFGALPSSFNRTSSQKPLKEFDQNYNF